MAFKILTVIGFIVFVVIPIALTPSKEMTQRWEKNHEQGRGFLEDLNGDWDLVTVAKLGPEARNSLIEQLGYEVDRVDEWLEWAVDNPEIAEVTDEVVDNWFIDYKQTRRSMRGANFLGGWRVT